MERSEPERERLSHQAAEYARQGEALALEGETEQAISLYLQALRLHHRLLEMTGDPTFARAAGEDCLCLADLSMELGNMHGADVYYVKAMDYGRRGQAERHPVLETH